MIIRVDRMGQAPLYQQIRDQIVEAVARGDLGPGSALPSVRSLAADLGINLHTVNKAYALLRDEGYVLMRGRSGAYVADFESREMLGRGERANAEFARALHQMALEHKARGGSLQQFMALAEEQACLAYDERGRS